MALRVGLALTKYMTNRMSIAMCTYNGARYLEAQLASIAAQTRLPDELIVCDDRSEDATCEIVKGFAASAPFIVRVYVNENNLGTTKNFERAIGLCEGDIIALSDQDDVWLPEKLRRIEDCFLAEPEVGLVFTDAEVVDEHLQPLGFRLWESVGFDNQQRRLVRNGRALDVLLRGWTVTGATMAFRASFKNLARDIPTDLPLIHDGWIALLIASLAGVSFIEEPLIKYRQHAQQQIGARETRISAGGAGPSGIKKIRRGANSYLAMIAIGMRAVDRLSQSRDLYECDPAIALLGSRIAHLHARASLPQKKRLGRLRSVLRELLSRRYHRYSNGISSAARDLLT